MMTIVRVESADPHHADLWRSPVHLYHWRRRGLLHDDYLRRRWLFNDDSRLRRWRPLAFHDDFVAVMAPGHRHHTDDQQT
jgi:hypothetical protein